MTEQLKPSTKGALTKLAAECHRAKWQFDFNDETRLPISQARDMVRRAFSELHRIGDMALRLRDSAASPPNSQVVTSYPEMLKIADRFEIRAGLSSITPRAVAFREAAQEIRDRLAALATDREVK